MDNRFSAPLLRELKKIDLGSSAEREAVYERFRSILRKMHAENRNSPEFLEDSLTLEDAIADAESTLGTHEAPTWIESKTAQFRGFTEQAKAKYWIFASAVQPIVDFLKPIFDLTSSAMVGSVVGGAGLLLASRYAGSMRARLQGLAVFCAIFFGCSTALLTAQNILPGASDKGVLADLIPQLVKVQQSMLASLQRIEGDVARTAVGVENVGKTVETLKRETSVDPRKELQNLGKNFNEQDFLQSMAMCDLRAVRLYKQADMKLPRYKAVEVLVLPSDMECLNEYKDQFVAIGPELCFSYDFVNPIFHLRTAPIDWIEKGFEIPERRKFIEGLCGEPRLREKYPRLYRGKNQPVSQDQIQRGRKECVDEMRTKYLAIAKAASRVENRGLADEVYSELLKKNEEVANIRSDALRLDFLSRMRREVMSDNMTSFLNGESGETVVDRTILRGCREAFPDAPKNDDKTNGKPDGGDTLQSRSGTAGSLVASVSPGAPASLRSTDSDQSAPRPAAPLSRDGPLGAEEVKQAIVSKKVAHGENGFSFWFKPDGSFEQYSGRVSSQGRYRIEADGRVCWTDEFKLSGCFQYYRKNNAIYVRGKDFKGQSEIGAVRITAR